MVKFSLKHIQSLLLLLGSYSKYSNYLEITITHLQNIPCRCYLNSWSPTLPYILSSYSRAPPKIRTFWTFPTLTSYSNHLNLNQMSLDLNLSIMVFSIFSEKAHFCESGKITPMRKCYPKHLLPSSFLLCYFLF